MVTCLRFEGLKLAYTWCMDQDEVLGCLFVSGLFLLVYMGLLVLGIFVDADVNNWPICRVPAMGIAACLLVLVILNVILRNSDKDEV